MGGGAFPLFFPLVFVKIPAVLMDDVDDTGGSKQRPFYHSIGGPRKSSAAFFSFVGPPFLLLHFPGE